MRSAKNRIVTSNPVVRVSKRDSPLGSLENSFPLSGLIKPTPPEGSIVNFSSHTRLRIIKELVVISKMLDGGRQMLRSNSGAPADTFPDCESLERSSSDVRTTHSRLPDAE